MSLGAAAEVAADVAQSAFVDAFPVRPAIRPPGRGYGASSLDMALDRGAGLVAVQARHEHGAAESKAAHSTRPWPAPYEI
jgi:hypothetical protein